MKKLFLILPILVIGFILTGCETAYYELDSRMLPYVDEIKTATYEYMVAVSEYNYDGNVDDIIAKNKAMIAIGEKGIDAGLDHYAAKSSIKAVWFMVGRSLRSGSVDDRVIYKLYCANINKVEALPEMKKFFAEYREWN